MAQQPTSLASMEEAIAEHRLWFLVLGVLLIVLGIIAVAFPFMTTIAVKIFLGWLLLIAGIAQIIHAFAVQKWSEFLLNLLVLLCHKLHCVFVPTTRWQHGHRGSCWAISMAMRQRIVAMDRAA